MNTEQYGERAVRAICLFFAFLPFIVFNSALFPFVSGKVFIFRSIATLAFAGWLWLSYRGREVRFRVTLPLILFSVFFAWMAMAAFFAIAPHHSIWSGFERMNGVIEYIYLLMFLIATGAAFGQRERFRMIPAAIAVSAALLSLTEIAKLASGAYATTFRIGGSFGNPAYLGTFLLLSVFLSAFLLFDPSYRAKRIWISGAIAMELFVLYETGTRASWLGLAAGVFLGACTAFFSSALDKKYKKIAGTIAICLILLACGAYAVRDSAAVHRAPLVSRALATNASDEPRTILWQIAVHAIAARPVLGWGPENFSYAFNRYYDPRLALQEKWFDDAHNSFLDWIIAGGIPLGLLYLSFFAMAGWALVQDAKKDRRFSAGERAALAGFFAAYAVNQLFLFDLPFIAPVFFAVLLWAGDRLFGKEISFAWPSARAFRRSIFIGAIALVAGVFFVTAVWPLIGVVRAHAAEDPSLKDAAERMRLYRSALVFGGSDRASIRESMARTAERIAADPDMAIEDKASFVNAAIAEEEQERDADPLNGKTALLLGEVLTAGHRSGDAVMAYERALPLLPQRRDLHDALAAAYQAAGEPEKAIGEYKQSFELMRMLGEGDSRYQFYIDEAFERYAAAFIFAGHTSEGEAMLTKRYGTTMVSRDAIINAYAHIGRYDAVARLWEDRAKRYPDNSQYRFSLAAAYFALGRRAEAAQALEAASALHPELKSAVDYYVHLILSGAAIDVMPGR